MQLPPAIQRLARAFPRLIHSAVSLAIVLAAYFVYAIAMVPLIEPPAQAPVPTPGGEALPVVDAVALQRAQLSAWFQEGDWELTSPKMLETPQAKLIFREYENLGSGLVRLQPCTVIFLPENPAYSEEERAQLAVVMRAPQGALLKFDSPIDLRKAKIGKLIGGELTGEITFHSRQRAPGPEDDLWIMTRDVQLDGTQVHTPHAIDFRLGPHYGHGRELRMELSPEALGGHGATTDNLAGSVQSLELVSEVQVHLQPGSADLFPGGKEPPPESEEVQPPVEVRSAGPFKFDFVANSATFNDRVEVLRVHPEGPSDQLTCDRLTIFFLAVTAAEPTADSAVSHKLEPSRLEAVGSPVIVRAPSSGFQARGRRLEYDLQSRQGGLKGDQEVFLYQGQNEVHAREIEFGLNEAGELNRFRAAGAGWLRGELGGDRPQPISARWNRQLYYRPHEGQQVLSVEGAAHLEAEATGEIDAQQLHLWLTILPAEEGRMQLQPDRVLARGRVEFDTQPLDGRTEELAIWFEHPARAEGQAPAQPIDTAEPAAPLAQPAVALEELPAPRPAPTQATAERQQEFTLKAAELRARVYIVDNEAQLREALAQGEVRLEERTRLAPEDEPLRLRGGRVHLVQMTPDAADVTVAGPAAYVAARGMALTATDGTQPGEIRLDQQQNRLWVAGPGSLTLPVSQDLAGEQASGEQTLVLTWNETFDFDGQLAALRGDVLAQTDAQSVRTPQMDVTLAPKLSFTSGSADTRPNLLLLECSGGVQLAADQVSDGQLLRRSVVQTPDLRLDGPTGDLTTSGPGRLESVQLGRPAASLSPPGQPAPPVPEDAPLQWSFVGVDFQGGARGNMQRKELTFVDQVVAVYGPVPDAESKLDANNLEALPPQGMLLHCEQLTVAQMPAATQQTASLELEATDAVSVDGQQFRALCERLSYSQFKDLLIIEGTPRSDAEMYYQQRAGGQTSRFAGQRVRYWRSTGRVQVNDARMLDLTELPGGTQR